MARLVRVDKDNKPMIGRNYPIKIYNPRTKQNIIFALILVFPPFVPLILGIVRSNIIAIIMGLLILAVCPTIMLLSDRSIRPREVIIGTKKLTLVMKNRNKIEIPWSEVELSSPSSLGRVTSKSVSYIGRLGETCTFVVSKEISNEVKKELSLRVV